MALPDISGSNARKPIAYDPLRNKFILFAEVVNGTEPLYPVGQLAPEALKQLVIERLRQGPDFQLQSLGPDAPMNRDAVIQAIERDTPFGRMNVEAETAYLEDLHQQLRQALGR